MPQAPGVAPEGLVMLGEEESLRFSLVIEVAFHRLGYLPVLIDNGRVVADVARWITHNKRRGGKAPSTLRGYATGLGRWCDFWNFTQSENSETPINDFFETLVHGSERLGWENVAVSTAKRIVEILYLFLDWYTEESGLEHPNPKIEEELSWGAKMAERARRYKSDVRASYRLATVPIQCPGDFFISRNHDSQAHFFVGE